MPNITGPALSFPTKAFPGSASGSPTGVVGELNFSEVVGKYSTLVKAGKVFYTSAIITAPVIFSTAIQLGPMLWNKSGSNIDAHILALSVGAPTTATTVAGSLGLSTNNQTTAPTTPTAITAVNAYAGGGASQLGAVNSGGTVIILPVPIFLPLVAVNTGAITTAAVPVTWCDVGGLVVAAPGTVAYVCASATLTSGVFTIGLVWAELPA